MKVFKLVFIEALTETRKHVVHWGDSFEEIRILNDQLVENQAEYSQ